ncbi:MAG: hypothetical protein GY938_16470, partial [Ketobacter sp.]|nr:hypothetical protein [Ketobacter sp.]
MFGGGDDDPALNFDGTSIYGELTDPLSLTGDFEVEVLFTPTTAPTGGSDSLLSTPIQGMYLYVYRPSALVSFVHYDGSTITHTNGPAIDVLDGREHTAKVTRVGTTYTVYVDGVVGESNVINAPVSDAFELVGLRYDNQNYFEGQIKSIKFIDKSGASDVIKTYPINSGPPVYEMGAGIAHEDVVGILGTFTDHGDGSYSIEDGLARVRYPLSELIDGQPYVGAVNVTANTAGALVIDMSDTGVEYWTGAVGVIQCLGLRSEYTASYRFVDVSVSGGGSVRFIPHPLKPYISTISDGTLYQMIAGGSLGSELVIDGGFDNPASWSEFAGWTVGGGVATSTGGGFGVYQDLTGWAVSGQHYLLGVTAKTLDAGRLDIRVGNGDAQNYGGTLTAAGVSLGVAQWSGVGSNFNVMSLDSSFIGTADDATVKALPE